MFLHASDHEGLPNALIEAHWFGKPVVSSNHATAWHCLRLAGVEDPVPGFGELFRRGLG